MVGTDTELHPTITSAGSHTVKLVVNDQAGSAGEATTTLMVGNERPDLSLALEGNQTFLLPGRSSLRYTAAVEDAEDRAAGRLKTDGVIVNAAWVSDADLVSGLRRGEATLPV